MISRERAIEIAFDRAETRFDSDTWPSLYSTETGFETIDGRRSEYWLIDVLYESTRKRRALYAVSKETGACFPTLGMGEGRFTVIHA